MKTKSIITVLLTAFLFCPGNLFAELEEENKPQKIANTTKTIEDGTVEIRGSESTTNTYYGLSAGSSSSGGQNSFFGASSGRTIRLQAIALSVIWQDATTREKMSLQWDTTPVI